MCGAHLKSDFLILEGAQKPAGKLAVSGGGRCNFTNENISVENYTGEQEFIASILQKFSFDDMLGLAKKWKIPFDVCKNRQLFCSKTSKEIITPLLEHSKGRIVTNTKLISVSFEKNEFILQTTAGIYNCNNLVIASGGVSYPLLGASDIGYSAAGAFGHAIVSPRPALVGFTVQPGESWFKELSGISITARVSVGSKSFVDSVLFAHKGISGPAILNASLYWEKGLITIDFLPDTKELESLLVGQKQVTTLLGLPKRFSKAFLGAIGVEDKIADKLNATDKEKLLKLKNYSFAPAGTFGLTKAEITKGGVSTVDINPQTMESKLQKRLYFAGEVLDVNGELGGYNFHFAFASALLCAKALNASSKHPV
jgi:hypothetical protein